MEIKLDTIEHVAGAFAQPESGRLTTEELYRVAAGRAGIPYSELQRKVPVGEEGVAHNLLKRKIRWSQQTLREMGIIQRVEGQRGVWELTDLGRKKLRHVKAGVSVLGFSTDLGIAILGNSELLFQKFHEDIYLCLTSPPYPIATARAYGGPSTEAKYIDFISRILEPIVRKLVPGGNVALNLSNDVFEPGLPSRSLYLEKLTIMLRERFDLRLMDRLVWENPNKPPGPMQWASRTRQQLNVSYEPVLWFCNDPSRCIANNRRALEPHSAEHMKVMAQGGEKRRRVNSDGAYYIRKGAFGNQTAGRIPKNILHASGPCEEQARYEAISTEMGLPSPEYEHLHGMSRLLRVSSTCASQRSYKREAKGLRLSSHGAPMPLELARKLVKFLTDKGQLVVDPCAGSMTTPLASELEGRPWVAVDQVYDYVRGGAERFVEFKGYECTLPVLPQGTTFH